MKVLVLLGEASSGKSMTLKCLMEYVVSKLYAIDSIGGFFRPLLGRKCKTFVDHSKWTDFLTDLHNEMAVQPKAIQDAFTKFCWDEKTVGIFTIGDDKNYLNEKINQLMQCDIIVCPSHEKREMLKFLFEKSTEEIWFIRKEKLSKDKTWDDMVKASQTKATELFDRLDFMVHH